MFTITKDHIAEPGEESRVGTKIDAMPLYGIERAVGMEDDIPTEGPTVKFRLLDGDEEVYYEGELTDDAECENQSAALRWGEADAGCAFIQVLRDGAWIFEIA